MRGWILCLRGTMYCPPLLSWSVELGSATLEWGPRNRIYLPCVSNSFYSCLQFIDALFFLLSEIVWETFANTAKKHFSEFSNLNQTAQVSTRSPRASHLYCWLFYLGLPFERSRIFTVLWKFKARVLTAGWLGWRLLVCTPWESGNKAFGRVTVSAGTAGCRLGGDALSVPGD